ncbi:cupin domain-containing protein [Plantactinospora sp. WMMB334]|uniref:cupin domain-containing protein n=1 Tax=Plantactinospora sp. WMMB334 TaxID=3404119 RepID=UPI003B92B65D
MILNRCVGLPAEKFLADHFGTRHLHTPAADLPAGFTDLFTAQSVEDLLIGAGLRTTSVRLVRDGKEVPAPGVVERGDTPAEPAYVDTDRIRRAIAAGSTLILRSLHRYHPPVRRLAHQLAAELGCPVRVNAFITPPESTGVDLHYDVQDVFVLQIAGTKLWHLRTPPIPSPLPSQAWFDQPAARRERLRTASKHLDDVVLRTGDSLYLPRGTMHAPRTQNDLSIHLTIALSRPTRHDLLNRLVEAAADDEWLRAAVNPQDLADDPDSARNLLDRIARRLPQILDRVNVGDLVWGLRREAFRDLPPDPVPVLPRPPAASDVYQVRAGAQYAVNPTGGEGLRLHVPGKQVTLPASTSALFAALASDGWVSLTALAGTFGDADARKLVDLLVDLDIVTAATHDVEGDNA